MAPGTREAPWLHSEDTSPGLTTAADAGVGEFSCERSREGEQAGVRAGVESTLRPARRAELAVQRIEERRLRVLGMPAAHYSLLVSLDAEPGSSGTQPARRLGVTP